MLQQVLVEEQHGQCQVTPGRLLQGLEELVLILLVGLGSTSLLGETKWGTVSGLNKILRLNYLLESTQSFIH